MNMRQENKLNPEDTRHELEDRSSSLDAESKTILGQTSDASPKNRPISLQAGDTLGKYEIRTKIGQGGMGVVYLGYDPMIEREVAIKVLPPVVAENPEALKRFLAEAKAIGKLNHPNVVAIYDIGYQEELHYIVMELLSGGSLSELNPSEEFWSWQDACRMTSEAAEGLAAAHSVGLVHRDIKPENLMLTQEGLVKVVDFGLSKLTDAANDTREVVTKMGQILGTPQYMSPEQFQCLTVDARSDIYGLGGTLFRLLTNKVPYDECKSIMQMMYAHLEQAPPDPSLFNSNVPEGCKIIIERAMAKSPDDRYQDAGQMALQLKELIFGKIDAPTETEDALKETYRPLKSIVIVEPSKMQSLMLQDKLKKAGVDSVQVFRQASEALQQIEKNAPDVVITAMQLPDIQGIELISQLRKKTLFRQTMFALNSSDSTMEELIEAGQSGTLALVSKKTKPDEILHTIHASTFYAIPQGPLSATIDPSSMRFSIIYDADRIPDTVASLIRRLGLIDLQITTFEDLAAGSNPSGTIDLTLILRTAGDAVKDTRLYTDLLAKVKFDTQTVIAVQVDGEDLTLRAVQSGGFITATRCPLDDARLIRVLQISSK